MNEPIVSFDIDGGSAATVNPENENIVEKPYHVHLGAISYNALCAIDSTNNQFDYPAEVSTAPTHIFMYQTKADLKARFFKLGTIAEAVTLKAASAVTAGSLVCLAAEGKVQEVPETAGTYQIIGIALADSSNTDSTVSVQTMTAVEKVVTE